MGQAVSCVEPQREEGPLSWPEDHPGRAIALKVIEQRKAEGKTVGSLAHYAPGGTRVEVAPNAVEVGEEEHLADPELAALIPDGPLVGDSTVEKTALVDAGIVSSEAANFRDTPKEKVSDATEDGTVSASPISGADGGGEDEGEVEGEKSTTGGKTSAKYVDEVANKIPDGELKLDEMTREEFSDEKDTLPEAKDVQQKVRDPITKEMVSQEEFRSRVKTRGVVHQRVSKFETIDSKAAIEKAQYDAQQEARASVKKAVSLA